MKLVMRTCQAQATATPKYREDTRIDGKKNERHVSLIDQTDMRQDMKCVEEGDR